MNDFEKLLEAAERVVMAGDLQGTERAEALGLLIRVLEKIPASCIGTEQQVLDEDELRLKVESLPPRLAKTYARIRDGHFYMWKGDGLPKSVGELEAMGLIRAIGRPMVFVAAYVPAIGYQPYTAERFLP